MADLGWGELLELFGYAVLSALVAGLVCPLIGCFLLVRRTGFYGVALPQFAAAGIAFGWALPVWATALGWAEIDLEVAQLESPHAVNNYLMGLAGLFTFGGLIALLLLDKRKETETGRVAAAFAIASAATILLSSVTPHGAEVVDQLMHGEILTADLHEFETIGVAYGIVLVLTLVFGGDLLLASYDPDTARILGLGVRRIEGLLLSLIGLTVSVGVMVVGPVVLFGLLVLPPLAARSVAWSMRSFLWLANAMGVLAALAGIVVSFAFDWSLGPSVVAVAAVVMVPAFLFGRWSERRARA